MVLTRKDETSARCTVKLAELADAASYDHRPISCSFGYLQPGAAMVYESLRGNALRLLLAAIALALMSGRIGPVDFSSRAAQLLLISAVIDFSLGDVGLFLAYPSRPRHLFSWRRLQWDWRKTDSVRQR
ncbi:MAG: hypothetical protein K8R87_13260 [Verrucomicrobia bacterium]|nr:hypothetical protein [Verrucomicrobiota bacterium]